MKKLIAVFLGGMIMANTFALSPRKESIAAVSALAAKGDLEKLKTEIDLAFENGLTVNELGEIFLQTYAYSGFPKSLNAQSTLAAVVDERNAQGKTVVYGTTPNAVPAENKYDNGREVINSIFKSNAKQSRPETTGYSETTDVFLKEHLFNDITSRDNLNVEERELATASMLGGIGNVNPQLSAHLNGALNSGNTESEMREAVKVISKRVGKKEGKNMSAVLESVIKARSGSQSSQSANASTQANTEYPPEARVSIFPVGKSNDGFAQYFVGNSYLAPLSTQQVGIFNVTFEPGCRNNWHIHNAETGGGQILICVGGRGWYQEEGKPAQALNPGDVVNIPAGVKHWHGAQKDSWFAHLAVEVPGTNTSNTWLEPVTDEEYAKLGK